MARVMQVASVVLLVLLNLIDPSRTQESAGCRVAGYQDPDYGDRCFKIVDVSKTWPQAETECVADGGHLFSIGENQDKVWLTTSTVDWDGWIGLHSRYDPSTWEWSDGTDYLSSRVVWRSGEPNSDADRCALWMGHFPFGLNDADCDQTHPFVCAIDKVVSERPNEIIEPVGGAIVLEGGSVQIKCRTRLGEEMEWQLDGRPLSMGGKNIMNQELDMATASVIYTLTRYRVLPEDMGTYACVDTGNTANSATVDVRVHTPIPIEITEPTEELITVNQGESVTLICTGDAFAAVEWRQSGMAMTSGDRISIKETRNNESLTLISELTFNPVQLMDKGRMTCLDPTDPLGQIDDVMLNVLAPRRQVQLTGEGAHNLTVTEGGSFTLNCLGDVQATLVWSQDGVPLTEDIGIVITDAYDPAEDAATSLLTVEGMTSQQEGVYVCKDSGDDAKENTASSQVFMVKECRRGKGRLDYTGKVAVTRSGQVCKNWVLRPDDFVKAANFPEDTIAEAANYCRNPDSDSRGTWCYTTNRTVLWETCDIPLCDIKSKPYVSPENRLYEELLSRVNPNLRPAPRSNKTITVHFGILLLNIVDVDERAQTLTLQVWLRQMWHDYQLKWDPDEYDGVKSLRIPHKKIWNPDIVLYNSASDRYKYPDTNVVVESSGSVFWVPPVLLPVSCSFDMTFFPFDTQECDLKFGSWTYDGKQVDPVFFDGVRSVDLSSFWRHNEWTFRESKGEKNIKYYDCCAEPYPDITFTLVMERARAYYVAMFIVPAVLLLLLAPFIFLVPRFQTQKFTLGGLLLVCICLLLHKMENIMPSTSAHLPILACYYITALVLLVLSLLLSIFTTYLAEKVHGSNHPPKALKKVMLGCLGRVLCVSEDAYSPMERTLDEVLSTPPSGGGDDKAIFQYRPNFEWRLIANVFDRLFCVIFLVTFVVCTLAFFAR